MKAPTPVFVVVGHVNRGKSSIVSSLAADETVRIGDAPGTTRERRSFPMQLDGEILYTLIDTPGFERARHVLAWLRERETRTADRPRLVREFVEVHRRSGEYPQEVALLEPILDGAAVLYVVDGGVPFNPTSEAETEILRWSGQPRMALINRIGEGDYADQWRPVLDQYFSLVREFDAHQANFAARVALLRGLRELVEAWRPALDRAIEALRGDRAHARRESAQEIADALVEMLTRTEEERLEVGVEAEPHKAPLAARYFEALRDRELALRESLRSLYLHRALEVDEVPREMRPDAQGPLDEDLFDTSTWSRLGLSRGQLIASGATAGAVIGGGIDAATGGASFLVGSLLGSVIGGASSYWAWDRLTEVRVLGRPLGGALLAVGPMKSQAFPWVVLDRALLFHRLVANRSHSKRDPVKLSEAGSVVSQLSGDVRGAISAVLDRLGRRPDPGVRSRARNELAELLEPILEDE